MGRERRDSLLPGFIQALSVSDGIPCCRSPGPARCRRVQADHPGGGGPRQLTDKLKTCRHEGSNVNARPRGGETTGEPGSAEARRALEFCPLDGCRGFKHQRQNSPRRRLLPAWRSRWRKGRDEGAPSTHGQVKNLPPQRGRRQLTDTLKTSRHEGSSGASTASQRLSAASSATAASAAPCRPPAPGVPCRRFWRTAR